MHELPFPPFFAIIKTRLRKVLDEPNRLCEVVLSKIHEEEDCLLAGVFSS